MKEHITINSLLLLLFIILYTSCKKEKPVPVVPTPVPGNVIFFIPENFLVGKIKVTLNGITKEINDFSSFAPDCSQSQFAVFNDLPVGNYTYSANSELSVSPDQSAYSQEQGPIHWEGNVTAIEGNCKPVRLDYANLYWHSKGKTGELRFHLNWVTPDVDLDMTVTTPDGSVISWGQTSGQGGIMDVSANCITNKIDQENIYFGFGKAVHGTYTISINYADYCGTGSAPYAVNYGLHVYNGLTQVEGWGSVNTTAAPTKTFTYNY